MASLIRRLFGLDPDAANESPSPPEPPGAAETAAAVREAEADADVEPGRTLHVVTYDELTIRIDRDVIGLLRVTASQDTERRYSFSVRCESSEWEEVFEEIFGFLSSDRALAALPDSERVKGHFYGYGE